MKFIEKRAPNKTDDESGNETPTLGSSAESRYSNGLFIYQFSDTTDCERSLTPSCRPPLQSNLSSRQSIISMAPRVESSDNMGADTPLLNKKANFKRGFREYTKIPGTNDQLESTDGLKTSIQFFETYKYERDNKKKQSSIVTIFAVWNTIMGSSLLTMAWGIERAGLLPGILIMMFMGGLCLLTSHILLQVCYHHGDNAECEVSDLCRMLLGRWAEVIAKVFSLVVMLGANIVYWVLMTNFLYYSVNYFRAIPYNTTTSSIELYKEVVCPKNTTHLNMTSMDLDIGSGMWGGRFWDMYSTVPLYVAVIIFPLLNFNSTTFFTKFNSLGTLSVLYLMIFVMIKGAGWGLHIDSWVAELQIRTDFSVLSGMLALSFFIHNIIITVMRNNRHQENNARDLSTAFLLVTLTYMLVGAIFYICFPLAKTCIEDNILNNFAKSDIMTAVARVLLLFQVITVYPLIAYMLRVQILGTGQISRSCVVLFNAVVVTVCILFACFVPKIGTIIRYTGAVSGLVHVFTLPSLLQMMSLYIRGKLTFLKVFFYVSIFIIGLCNLVAQFFVRD